MVGEDTTVKGEIESRSDMLVEGRVEGQIHGHKRVIIGEKGNVEAKVRADVIIVRGTVNGDIEGATRVEITATGKVFGNITSRAIVVTEGATFRGSSKMAQDAPIRKVSSGPAPPEKTDGPGPTAPVGTTPAKGTTTAQPPAPGTRSASGST